MFFFSGAGLLGWDGSDILVRHNVSIIVLAEHNFEHNTLVSRLTPESIILYCLNITRQNLILGKNNRRRKKSRQGKQTNKQKKTRGTREFRKMSDDTN